MTRPSPTAARRQVGRALVELREAAGRTREDAAEILECSPSKISRLETGLGAPSAGDLALLLDLYHATSEQRAEVQDLSRAARQRRPRTNHGVAVPGWFRRYVGLEEAASELRTYTGELISGQLQTADYARALISSYPPNQPADVERLVEGRMARAAMLHKPDALHLWAIMSEAALRILVGGRVVMRDQLAHLLEMAELPSVTMQIVPFGRGAHPAIGFAFSVMRFPDGGNDVVYLEELTLASYLDRADDPQREAYVTVWESTVKAALDAKESVRLVDSVRREL
ncbi:helix-turn-helix transcriptional regulator [Actinokineospora auranticolor]|nr:helix-turn-helix transcriptional regulator [Actinokineospora auranticolor]